MEILHHYNNDHNTTSAKEIVPYILDFLPKRPESIIDVGCGVAQWLRVFKDAGVNIVLGVDGVHVPLDKIMVDPSSEFLRFDLRNIQNIQLDRRYDLALNLEVAEHLPEDKAGDIVSFLTGVSNIIIFSAAVEKQTGENHLNEQNPEYWKKHFEDKGFVMLDAFRDNFWNNIEINWWYRQNMFLVVKDEIRDLFPFREYTNFYIHPELFKMYVSMLDKVQLNRDNKRIKRRLIEYVKSLIRK